MSEEGMAASDRQAAALKRSLLLSFVLPTLVLGFMHGPEGQIQAIYAKHAGLALTALAMAMLLTKAFDALTYPLVGYLSDRTAARTGTRKHWIIAGAAVSMVGMWFHLRPPPGVGIVYFGVWTAVTYLGWKIMEIPLQAWSYGLTDDYAERARVQAWRVLATFVGGLLFYATPYLAVKLGLSDSTELDFRSLGLAAIICLGVMPLATAIAVMRVPSGNIVASPAREGPRFSVAETIRALRLNGPLIWLLAAFTPVSLLGGMAAGVSYLYVDAYLGLAKQFPAIGAACLLASMFGVVFWASMGKRFERHRAWAASLIIGGVAALAFTFVSPGPSALLVAAIGFPVITFSLSAAVLVYTMFGDIVDYGRIRSGQDLAGFYGSLLVFLHRSLGSISTAAGLALVGVMGFDATAPTQTASGVLGIKLAASLVPALGLFGAAIAIWNYPLTRAKVQRMKARNYIED